MIGDIISFHTIIQGNKLIGKNNQIKIHKTKDTVVINQISIIVSYTFNEKVKPFSINLRQNIHKMLTCHTNVFFIL